MLGACIDKQVVKLLCTKTCLGEHTLDCSSDELGRFLGEDLLRGGETLSTGISGVAYIHAVGHLLTLEGYLLCVDDDDVVTTVNVGSEAGLVLATEDKSDAGSETTKSEISRINDNPLLVYSRCIERYRFVALCVHCLDL